MRLLLPLLRRRLQGFSQKRPKREIEDRSDLVFLRIMGEKISLPLVAPILTGRTPTPISRIPAQRIPVGKQPPATHRNHPRVEAASA